MGLNPKSHEAKLKSNLQSHTHLRRSDTDMGIRDSFSRLKKKLKHPLTGIKRKSDKTGADSGGERVDSASSLSQLEPSVVTGGSHAKEDRGANADERQVGSTDQPPESVQTRGSEGDQEGGGVDLDRREASQAHPHPHFDVEVGVGSGPSRKGDGVDGEKVEQVHQETSWLLFSLLFAFLKLFFFASLFPLIQTYYFSRPFLTYRLFSACVYQTTNDSVATKELGVGR